ncbi:MAG: anaerobic ribonucleoside-triphosphate reductase activating protein [Candidatus Aminicenantes bacterium]|nr:anaerobic ribonucleoside-triphosphate reductase activating protein [Candidatus Aminicenantes bacterium]
MAAIKGLEKFAPKDFPGYISSTIFLGGCNFRCPFCQNPDLVLNPGELPVMPQELFIEFIDSRKGWLEAVCVTGGEPLIHKDLIQLLGLIKEKGLRIKLDTNGSFPERLREIIQKGLIDSAAMDIKAPLDKYSLASGVDVNVEEIKKSISILKNSNIEYMFRTTVVPGLIDGKSIEEIGRMLEGGPLFQIQQFSPKITLDESYRTIEPYPKEEVQRLGRIAEKYFAKVNLEGI